MEERWCKGVSIRATALFVCASFLYKSEAGSTAMKTKIKKRGRHEGRNNNEAKVVGKFG